MIHTEKRGRNYNSNERKKKQKQNYKLDTGNNPLTYTNGSSYSLFRVSIYPLPKHLKIEVSHELTPSWSILIKNVGKR